MIIEYGFLDSPEDDVNQLKNNYKQFAKAVGDAVLLYIGYNDMEYVVKAGESLWSIAKKFDTTVGDIKKINNLKTNSLSIGQKLIIPKDKELDNYDTYIVKYGDTLYSIANNFKISIESIVSNNNLSNSNLSIGQILLIPKNDLVSDYIIYTIKPGDSLYKIANDNNANIDELIKLNNLTNNLLLIGQKIKIPKKLQNNEEVFIKYSVKPGDSLYSISNKYNIKIDEIKKINLLDNSNLNIGQELLIPINNIYIVKAGDTLSSIAQKYNLTIEQLKSKNNLIDDKLFINQSLKI